MSLRPVNWNRLISIGMTVAAVAIAVPWLWHRYRTRPDWVDPVAHYILHVGLPTTLRMAALAVAGSVVIGIVLGTALTIRFRPTLILIRAYVEVWRGLPILITILVMYLGLPLVIHTNFTQNLTAFQGATIALILWGSAQVAETTRGAVQSIQREQHEAAAALGFGWIGRHVFVILPQAFRRLLPPLVGLLVNVIQNTSVAALIGVAETLETGTRSTERLGYATGDSHAFAIYSFVMVIFFVISFPLTRLASYLERRLL